MPQIPPELQQVLDRARRDPSQVPIWELRMAGVRMAELFMQQQQHKMTPAAQCSCAAALANAHHIAQQEKAKAEAEQQPAQPPQQNKKR